MKILFLLGILTSLAMAADRESVTHDFRNLEKIQVGDEVLVLTGKVFEGRVVEVSDGFIKVVNHNHWAPRPNYKASELSKSVECLGRICASTEAVGRDGRFYTVDTVFSNGLTSSRKGSLGNTFRPHVDDLYAKCKCVDSICERDTIISENGQKYIVTDIYQNGAVGYIWQNTVRYTTLSEIAAKAPECSNDAPCSCSKL